MRSLVEPSTLVYILFATLAGGVLSVLAAGLLSLTVLARWAPRLVSFAVGVLLAAAFLNLLPEAAANSTPTAKLTSRGAHRASTVRDSRPAARTLRTPPAKVANRM